MDVGWNQKLTDGRSAESSPQNPDGARSRQAGIQSSETSKMSRCDMDFAMKLEHDLGGDTSSKPVVSEVYSPPRITAAAQRLPKLGLGAGFALDLTTCDEEGRPWDFDIRERRIAARERVKKEQPLFLVGCPMCAPFCSFQYINNPKKDAGEVERNHVRAMLHLHFVCELYRDQVAAGRYFLHEHPETASSWDERCVKEVCGLPGVDKVVGDQCQFGQEYNHEPIRKATGWMSNSSETLKVLSLRCTGRGGRMLQA